MNRIFILFFLAWRNIRRNLRRSMMTGAVIMLAVVCLVVFLALKRGLHAKMVEGVTTLQYGALQIQAASWHPSSALVVPLEKPAELATLLAAAGYEAAAPRLSTHALMLAGRKSLAVIVSGVEPASEAKVTVVSRRMVAGSYLGGADDLLVSRRLAVGLGVAPGDWLKIMVQDASGRPAVARYRVGGLFETALASFDHSRIFLRLATLQHLVGLPGAVDSIALALPEAELHRVLPELSQLLPPALYQLRPWYEAAADVRQLIELNDGTMRLLIAIVFALVGLGVANVTGMTVFERFREFGILASMGMTPAGVVGLVLLESALLGGIAAVGGAVAGWGISSWLAVHGVDLTRLTSANQYFADSHLLKAAPAVADFVLVATVTLVTSLLAALYPALKAAGLDPARAMVHR